MRSLKPPEIVFANNKTEKNFNKLKETDEIKIYLKRAIKDIMQNAYCGRPLPKRLFPKEYIQKYKINNLWKYDLPDGWRLLYTITTPNKVEILAIILEWFNHKEYERRFNY